MKKLIYFITNLLIFISTIKETILFFIGIKCFQKIQDRKLKTLIEENKKTEYLNSIDNQNIPLSNWGNYEKLIQEIINGKQNILTKENVLLLEPTSGTTAPTKYIPYTQSLQNEFNKAIQPWLAGIYITWPKLLFCSQYWSISPEAIPEIQNKKQRIRIGFEQDSQYLGKGRSGLLDLIMSVPPEIKKCKSHESWAYLTAFFLLRDRNLGLISIWHPSFIIILIQKIKNQFNSLVDDIEKGFNSSNSILKAFSGFEKIKPNCKRANELKQLNIIEQSIFAKIWPNLKIISCWADNPDEPCLLELKKTFPNTFIQPKGLIATEGIVSFPFGRIFGIPAFRSHYLEFIDLQDESIKKLNQLENGQKYEVVISTSGGLYRYRMNDVVIVHNLYKNKLSQLQFLYKRDYVSNIRGEKISLQHIIGLQTEIKKQFPAIQFFMLSPVIVETQVFYACFAQIYPDKDFQFRQLAEFLDEKLNLNFHYQYARQIGQLGTIRIFKLHNDPIEHIINYIESTGIKKGDVKLYPLSRITTWHQILKGQFIDM